MTWILLRGLTREARHWGEFPAQLQRELGQRVLTMDLPGNGVFAAQPSPTSVYDMTAFVRAHLDGQEHTGPFNVLGMSLGAMVATDWAQRWPTEVAALVLINASMRPFSSPTERLRPHTWMQLALLGARWHDADYAEHVVHTLTCNRSDTRAADVAAWKHVRQTAPVQESNAQRQLWAAARFACACSPPVCPTLVLSSAGDQLVHPRCSQQLSNAWSVAHALHPWAGHDLPHDDAQWVVDQVIAQWPRTP